VTTVSLHAGHMTLVAKMMSASVRRQDTGHTTLESATPCTPWIPKHWASSLGGPSLRTLDGHAKKVTQNAGMEHARYNKKKCTMTQDI
jgi:hypothetical protein